MTNWQKLKVQWTVKFIVFVWTNIGQSVICNSNLKFMTQTLENVLLLSANQLSLQLSRKNVFFSRFVILKV